MLIPMQVIEEDSLRASDYSGRIVFGILIGLFGALSDEFLEHLVKTLTVIRLLPGETVFREGDPAVAATMPAPMTA